MILIFTLLTIFTWCNAHVLTPPYFNLAIGRKIEATATCGVGVPEPELFCKLTGANPDNEAGEFEVIQGQLCDYCDTTDPARTHSPEFAVDGTEKWWQSPPLSRGLHYNEVNLTLDLGQEFHVAYIFIKMGNSPRPGVFVLERSKDFGKTWQPWQFFADTPSDCHTLFGHLGFSATVTRDDSVICATEYSKVVPLESGEIVVSLVNNRPSANNFSYSQSLQEWTKATNIRLRLQRTKTLLGHLMAVARQDVTVTRRYYYSIKDISIGGQCVCNGHAGSCDRTDARHPLKLACKCQHNTCGEQCEQCCPGFIQKKWRPATLDAINECEPCQCYGRSTECRYDEEVERSRSSIDVHGKMEGGGVCINCQQNSEGVNCERCKFGYYRPAGVPLNVTNACRKCTCDSKFSTWGCDEGTGRCQCKPEFTGPDCRRCNDGYYGYPQCKPCLCHVNGTQGQVCDPGQGTCPCKSNYEGPSCDQCAFGFYGFPECKPCGCDGYGAQETRCDPRMGQCICHPKYSGRDCSQCAHGYYNYPNCETCNCDTSGSLEEVCNKRDGTCLCKENFAGSRCEKCLAGFYRFPHCISCNCNELGVHVNDCDLNGQCFCKPNFMGRMCDQCAPGYYGHPECSACNCNPHGSRGTECDQATGQCNCNPTFEGLLCNSCKSNYYNFPLCEECNCNPAGAKEIPGYPLGGCGSHTGGQLCECKSRVVGRLCDTCDQNFWNLNINNPDGCEDCDCDVRGTIGGGKFCDPGTGQCLCKPFVTGRLCNMCTEGMYNLQEHNTFGCQPCKCDVGGSLDLSCDKRTGQCSCKPRITGKKCESPISAHYFPNLHHQLFELEEGRTPGGGLVRYGFNEGDFPRFSWKGYAIFSKLQDVVLVDVEVRKPSLYRLIYRYINRENIPIVADVVLSPDAATGESSQTSSVTFQPTTSPDYAAVSAGGGIPATFVLNPGKWTVALKTSQSVYVDYVVLLPAAYYEATILQDNFLPPCTVPSSGEICKQYVYVDMKVRPHVRGSTGHTGIGSSRLPTQVYEDRSVLDQLGLPDMAKLDNRQTSIILNVPVLHPDKYVFVVSYFTQDAGRVQDVDVDVLTSSGRDSGILRLSNCPYSSPCRQFVADGNRDVRVFQVDGQYATLTLTGRSDLDLAVDAVYAIPYNEWDFKLITPRFKCVFTNGKCQYTPISTPPPGTKIYFETGDGVVDVSPYEDSTSKVVRLDEQAPKVNLRVAITSPGRYAIVSRYYQPYVYGFDVDVEIQSGGVTQKGTFKADYCPSVNGCHGVVKFKDVDVVDLRGPDIRISFNSSNPIWLDYLVIVPSISYDKKSLEEHDGADKSNDFINSCVNNSFSVGQDTTRFCKGSVYSLVTEYNNGALKCDCNADGSRSFNCEQYGGQCPCKQNIIGRTCSQCLTGYWGFPNCKKCQCATGLCHALTGTCVCPARVTGSNCDTCLARTFGFDPIIGCEDCDCDPRGVLDGNMECEQTSGQCKCQANVVGRKCDRCLPGYHGFPRCKPCSCDARGVLPEICDQYTAQCLCKSNVQGPQCSECKPSTFHLDEKNPKGCNQCFCFGVTSRCSSSNLRQSKVLKMMDWKATNVQDGRNVQEHDYSVVLEGFDVIHREQPVYWAAPRAYTGNKVTSYGGKLIYSIFSRIRGDGSEEVLNGYELLLDGSNLRIGFVSTFLPRNGEFHEAVVDLVETKFVYESTGASVSRDEFLKVLANLNSLLIRATHYYPTYTTEIRNVTLEVADVYGDGGMARSVEQCECPPNYSGTSCESCAPGYYRSTEEPHREMCVPCRCNNRAVTCDSVTGVCLNCRDNFEGVHCENCRSGHYHDLYSDTCRMCSCPHPNEANNFATTCDVSPNGVLERCHCLPGYAGLNCERCALGFWGEPSRTGGRCEKCNCHGNVNENDPLSCDHLTGMCNNCLHNTGGNHCERCEDGYYGDAILSKNCMRCECDAVGTDHCDHRTGSCICKPNVQGRSCNQCVAGAFGFHTGRGCEMCGCGVASLNNLCDSYTGQCQCRPGVTGRQCNGCEVGYWGYEPVGCQRCNCLSKGAVTCDPTTGQCQCLPGVTGPNCDRCLPKWVMIPQLGCKECDNCVHLLLDDIELLDTNVTHMKGELESVSVGLQTIKRLEAINQTVIQLQPRVRDLLESESPSLDLQSLKENLKFVQSLSDEVGSNSDRVVRKAGLNEDDAVNIKKMANSLYDDVLKRSLQDVNEAILLVQNILNTISGSVGGSNIDELLKRSEEMLNEIKRKEFGNDASNARNELNLATDTLNRAKSLMDTVKSQMNETSKVNIHIEEVLRKLQDLLDNSKNSLTHSADASKTMSRVVDLKIHVMDMVNKIKTSHREVRECLQKSEKLLRDAHEHFRDAKNAFNNLEQESSRLQTSVKDVEEFSNGLSVENERLRPLVDDASNHANQLNIQALELQRLIDNTKVSAESALRASSAYESISRAINEALEASQLAVVVAEESVSLSYGVADLARNSKGRSDEILLETSNMSERIKRLREKLERISSLLKDINEVVITEELTELVIGLDNLPTTGFGQRAQEAATIATSAQNIAEKVEMKVEKIIKQVDEDRKRIIELPSMIAEVNGDIRNAQMSLKDIVELQPRIVNSIAQVTSRTETLNGLEAELRFSLNTLKDQIKVARDTANMIRVGVNFTRESSLQVRNVEEMSSAGTISEVSLFFKTTDNNGLLYYIGPDMEPNEYMILELVDGRVRSRTNLGSGETVLDSEHGKKYSNDVWYYVKVKRSGGKMTLTLLENPIIVTGTELTVASSEIEGKDFVMTFDDNTRFYVGGVPDHAVAPLSGILEFPKYFGSIEHLKFNKRFIGLWNFVQAKDIRGAFLRGSFEDKYEASGAVTFGGNGYIIIDKGRYSGNSEVDVSFQMSTYAEDGLLFFMGDQDYFTLELKDGRLLFQYDLGSGGVTHVSDMKLNNGYQHIILAKRSKKQGLLKINGTTVGTRLVTPGLQDTLESRKEIYIGGFKGNHNISSVTTKGFKGCISNLKLGTNSKSLLYNIEAKDVTMGCDFSSRLVSFGSDGLGGSFVIIDKAFQIGLQLSISFKFRTNQTDALLFYIFNENQEKALSLSVVNGKLKLIYVSDDGETSIMLPEEGGVNDGKWHYVLVSRDAENLMLNLDDTYRDVKRVGRGSSQNNVFYLGGLPKDVPVVTSNVGSSDQFTGCIGDLTIGLRFFNFADLTPDSIVGATRSLCHFVDHIPPQPPISGTVKPPVFPTRPPQLRCALPRDPVIDEGGRGAIQFGLTDESRLEFLRIPLANSERSNLSLEFKTTAESGMVYYVSDLDHVDFVGIYLRHGSINVAFNCGGGAGKMTSFNRYNDGKWHKLMFVRIHKVGQMIIDNGVEILNATSGGSTKSIEVRPPHFVGGLPRDIAVRALKNLDGTASQFVGCIRGLAHDGIDFENADLSYGVSECVSHVEQGVFFYSDRARLILRRNFSVAPDFHISFEIKPRVLNAVLLSIHNPSSGDYLVIQLIDGELSFSMDNGKKQDIVTVHVPVPKNRFCDGNWHIINAIKAKNVVLLNVDGLMSTPGTGEEGFAHTNTEDDLFFGGVPENSMNPGLKTRDSYVGCLKNLKIDDTHISLQNVELVGKIDLNSCPAT